MFLQCHCSKIKLFYEMQVREEIEHLMDDDEDMADLYLTRKLIGLSSPISKSGAENWFASSPTTKSKSVATFLSDENDVDELEMLLEVINIIFIFNIYKK